MKQLLSSLQWLAFIFSSSIIAPIAVASLFGLNPIESADFIQRAVFVLGVAGLLQVLIGHKLPINEGPAGLWWGVFALYAGLSTTLFASHMETLQALQGALLVSGVFFILLSSFGFIKKLSALFTPTVTGVYLLLLVLQLSESFIKGMLGINGERTVIHSQTAILSVLLVIITFWLTRHKKTIIKQYAILLSLLIGWLLFAIFHLASKPNIQDVKIFSMPEMFAFGKPIFNAGMIITAIFVTFLLIANMIASIRITETILKKMDVKVEEYSLNRSGLISGFTQMLGGAFSTMGPVPISGAGGFIAATGISKRLPFIIASILVILISFFPPIMSIFAAMPPAVGYSVSFVIFAGMLSVALSELQNSNDRIRTVIGVALLSGTGVMFLPTEAFAGIHPVVTSLLSNGLILGTFVCICGEQFLKYLARKTN
ncbi:purine/pyrimidine permease [Bacillus massiliigorillae]|uniref:purine/pyrimidine permease n=1 Tax=Bacillus massiliigorillae TaxID=1243664 RepID=UPI00039B386F|nr:purine/pyrimidine permease [Bacillus massiliigorillae]